jgi:hypothetical protein
VACCYSSTANRSGGERGADIKTLRGSQGADFEGNATIQRAGGVGVSCGCFGGSDDKSEQIILIKGPYCFVFGKETDQAPKYAISLAHLKAKLQSPSHGMFCVTIETTLGDVDWELGFSQKQTAQQFVDAFAQQAAIGEADEVRKVGPSFCVWVISVGPDLSFGRVLFCSFCWLSNRSPTHHAIDSNCTASRP